MTSVNETDPQITMSTTMEYAKGEQPDIQGWGVPVARVQQLGVRWQWKGGEWVTSGWPTASARNLLKSGDLGSQSHAQPFYDHGRGGAPQWVTDAVEQMRPQTTVLISADPRAAQF